MEFKFRAVDKRPTPTSYPPPLSTVSYVSHRSMRAGFSSMVPRPNNTHQMPNLNNAREALQRELEKGKIRREIIAGEIARRRMLEEEVRRELMGERAVGRNLAERFSLEERLALRLNPRAHMVMMHPFEERFAFNACPEPRPQQLPQTVAADIKPPLETKKNKVIILAKPDPSLYSAKRKAVTPPAAVGNERSLFGLKKKPKEEWSCALCQVSATSERGLNEHLQGRKHKAKEAALRNQKFGKVTSTSLSSKKSEKSVKPTKGIVTSNSGLDAKADLQSLQPSTTCEGINQIMVGKVLVESKNEEQLVQRSQNTEPLKKQNGTVWQEGRIDEVKRRKNKFWCEICQVGTCSEMVMESHKRGRKHLTRMKKFSQNNGSTRPPASSTASLEATRLIKDTDAVNTETDRKITHVLNKETVIKMINQASPVAESSGERAGEEL